MYNVLPPPFRLKMPQIGVGNVEVTSEGGISTTLDSGDVLYIKFIGIYGGLPLLTQRPASRATVTSVQQGDAPFRKETQAFTCSASSVGSLFVSWRGLGNVTIQADDDLNTFGSALSSGLTNVTVKGTDMDSVCSGKLVYVTFEEVRYLLGRCTASAYH